MASISAGIVRGWARTIATSKRVSRAYGRPMALIILLITLLPICVLLVESAPRAGGGIVVNTLGDNSAAGDGRCSLREAIGNTNSASDMSAGDCAAGTGADTISFSISGTITLNATLPEIQKTVTIDGSGRKVTLSGDATYQVLSVGAGATLKINALTIAHGSSSEGAGINNAGTLTVADSTFTSNSASSDGGAIENSGTLTISNSTFAGNVAPNGGGIYNLGAMSITSSTFAGSPIDSVDGGSIANSILTDGGNGNCAGTIADGGYNISSDASCGFGSSGNGLGDNVDPRNSSLGLQDNGGPTNTIALESGSPAVNAIPASRCAAFDQRGIRRHDGSKSCDAGAVESSGVVASDSGQPGPVGNNSFGTGSVPSSTIPGTSEPGGVQINGRLLVSVVAIEGTGAASANLCLPTTPGPWVSIGDWNCNGGSGNEIHVAAAYRITDSNDSPGAAFTWSFSSTACDSPTPQKFLGSVTNTLFSGVNTADLFDVIGSPTCSNSGAGGSVTAAAITTTRSDELLFAIFDVAGSRQALSLPRSGSDLGPIVGESNSGQGPANFVAFASTADVGMGAPCDGFNDGECGAPGSYGPFTAVQAAAGEGLGVVLSLGSGSGSPTPTPTATATPSGKVTLLPSSIDFGNVTAGQSSSPVQVTLSNGTKKKLTIKGTAIAVDFVIVSTTCSSSLAADSSCDYFISFRPQRAGTKKGTFRVTDSAGSQKVNLKGVGVR